MSSARRKKMEKSTIIKIVIAAVIVLGLGTAAVLALRSQVNEQFGDKDKKEVQTAQVTTGSISTTVSGSGTLANEDSEDTFIPATVEVKEIYVNAGDTVKEKDMLASVDSASVVKAMKEVQDKIEDVDADIAELESEDVSETITAGVAGRVKKIYAKADKDVADIMYKNGSLMLISADSYLAVDVDAGKLSRGDSVSVKVKDAEYSGTVDNVWGEKATVLITDDGPAFDAEATVSKDGKEAGKGKTYIHKQVEVTGFTGKISSISVDEGTSVAVGDTLLTIEDASSTVSYASLLEKRSDLEDELQDLIVIYKEGALYAKGNGLVTAISETSDSKTTTTATMESSSKGGMPGKSSNTSKETQTTTTVTEDADAEDGTTISICPTDSMTVQFTVDESDILSLKVGQTARVTISALGEDTYKAKITDLDTVGTSTDGVTTYTATLTLDREEGMLDGMSASAVITIEGKDNALLVPVEAVHKTSSTSYVYTSYDEESDEFGDMVEVEAGLSNSEYTEISSGLEEGDTVYYTEEEEESPFPNFGGGMPGGGMPNFGSGSGMPTPPSGGDRPSRGSGERPSFGGGAPGGK